MSDLFGDGAGNAPPKRGKTKLSQSPPSGATSAGAGTGGPRYSKPRLRVRPALPWAALATLQAMGVRVTGETARHELTWEWSDGR